MAATCHRSDSERVVCSGRAILSHASESGDFCLGGVVVPGPFFLGVDTDATFEDPKSACKRPAATINGTL